MVISERLFVTCLITADTCTFEDDKMDSWAELEDAGDPTEAGLALRSEWGAGGRGAGDGGRAAGEGTVWRAMRGAGVLGPLRGGGDT